MKKVAVFFGGRSVEHEVSVITGMQVMENMDHSKYAPVPVYITKEGKWLGGEVLKNFKTFKEDDFSQAFEVFFNGKLGDHNLYKMEEQGGGLFSKKSETMAVYEKIDLVFPALHGTNGEDGTIQGYLDTIDIPYVGCSTSSAALGMDKVFMKQVFLANDIPVLDYRVVLRSEWEADPEAAKAKIEELGYPVFVKPSNLGSSIGISRVAKAEELDEAIELATNYDRKIIIERAAIEPREINIAVLGYENNLKVSACEEPVGWKELLSFEDKYVSGSKGNKGTKGGENPRNIPADLDEDLRLEIEKQAKRAFKSIDAAGTARVDCLVEDGKVYVNEINTLPGSIGFYLWEAVDLDFKSLITELLEIAELRYRQRENNLYIYDANLFTRTGYGSKL